MYRILNPTNLLLDAANDIVIKTDRMLYSDYFVAIEKFANENGGIIAGNNAAQLLLNEPISRNSFMYEIYMDNAVNNAHKLADTLYKIKHPLVNPKYISCNSEFGGRETKVYVDTRLMAVIRSPTKFQQIPITTLMGDNCVKGYFQPMVNVVPVEFLLIDIYRKLYSPGHVDEWARLYEIEPRLYSLVEKSLRKNMLNVVGGGDSETNLNKEELSAIIVEQLRNADFVLIGDYAAIKDTNKRPSKRGGASYGGASYSGVSYAGASKNASLQNTLKNARLQIISALPIDKIITQFTTAITRNKQVKLIYSHATVTADIRVLKYSISAWTKQKQVHLCDVYTSAAVEPIPYVMGKGILKDIKVGNLYVRARFCLIDLWAMKLIINQNRRQGNEKVGWSVMRIDVLLQQYAQIKKDIQNTKPKDLFQLTDYIGIYETPATTKRRLYPGYPQPYYPAAPHKGGDDNDNDNSSDDDNDNDDNDNIINNIDTRSVV